MKPSEACYDIIKRFEGCRLRAYKDPGMGKGGLPITIGWGSTMRPDGSRFHLGETITQQEADFYLKWEVNNKAVIVESLMLKVFLAQNQFDAIISFTYNVGVGNFERSTLRKLIRKNPNDPLIPAEFKKWVRAGKKVLKGLVIRRASEAELYTSHLNPIP